MKILNDFLQSEFPVEQTKYTELIKNYCYEKIWDPKENPEDLNNYLSFLIFSANSTSVNHKDVSILLLLEICFSIGISLVDDIIDNELTPIWADLSMQEVINLACHFTCIFPQKLILNAKGLPQETKINLINLITKYYIRISSGEYKQASNSINDSGEITLKNSLDAMVLKTGEWKALIATMAICYANQTITTGNRYIKFARELGIFRQMKNDMYDIFVREKSQDLLSGILNFPLSAYAVLQDNESKKEFFDQIKLCQKTQLISKQLRKELHNEDLIAYCLLILNLQKYKLELILDQFSLPGSLKSRYLKFINS